MSEKCPWRDGDKLRKKYHEEGMTQREIADEWGCTKSCISRWMSNHDIETDRGLIEELRNEDWLREQYVEKGKSAMEIADDIGCSEYPVFYWLDKHGIETRTNTREKHLVPTTGPRGYERLHTTGYEGKDKVKFHRLVAIAKYGLEPVLEYEVHHKNGIPWDNRPSNLELRSHDDHARVHAEKRDRDNKGRFVS